MHHRGQDDKTLTRLIWIRVVVGELLRFAVIAASKLTAIAE